MALRLNGSTSGYVELDAPAVAGTTALTLPATAGTVATQAYADTAGATLGGLVHITTQSFSAVSSVSVNNCFTSTYANYRIVTRLSPSIADTTLLQRMRASGTDLTSALYYWKYFNAYSVSSITGATANTDTSARVAVNGTSSNSSISTFDIFQPQMATSTQQVANGFGYDASIGGPALILTGFVVDNTTQYDGFTLYPGSGTITGTLRVYGYKN